MMLTRHLSLEDLQTGLNELGESPLNNGTLEMIVCRPSSGERHILEQAELSLIDGLIGDNWRMRGSKSTPDGSADLSAQITIMNSRVIQSITQDRSLWSLAGDQLFIDLDFGRENLPTGQRLAISTAILEVSEVPHNGCAKFTERFGSGATHFVNSPEGRQSQRRGINMRVVQAGTIRAGDKVSKIS